MRGSPSIVPGNEQDVYLVLDDYGEWGSAWRETDVQDSDLESMIVDLLEGQYRNPVRVVGVNLSKGWVRDVSEAVAQELRQRCADQERRLPECLEEFVTRYQTSHWLIEEVVGVKCPRKITLGGMRGGRSQSGFSTLAKTKPIVERDRSLFVRATVLAQPAPQAPVLQLPTQSPSFPWLGLLLF